MLSFRLLLSLFENCSPIMTATVLLPSNYISLVRSRSEDSNMRGPRTIFLRPGSGNHFCDQYFPCILISLINFSLAPFQTFEVAVLNLTYSPSANRQSILWSVESVLVLFQGSEENLASHHYVFFISYPMRAYKCTLRKCHSLTS